MALTSSGIDSIGTHARINTARLTDLFDAFGTEVDRDGLAVFLRAHLKPGMGVLYDAIGKSAESLSR